jgi:DNA-binding CsgD family transcriptional regulator
MKTRSTVLTKEERDVLILAALHGQHRSNTKIAQRLGVSVNRVKTLIHQACVKLGAHNRIEAILFAIRRGEIRLTEFYSLEEMAEILSVLGPDMLRRIAQLVRQKLEHGHLPHNGEQIICTEIRQDTILTKRERDVLILTGRRLTNREIADSLYISPGSVKIFLNRACTKLGARKRDEAVLRALKQREISVGDIASLNDIVQYFAPSEAESVEKMAQLLDQKLGQEPIPSGS